MEQQGKYDVEESVDNARIMAGIDDQPAAEIHPPKTINAVYENGLNEYKVWGWVKTSSKFIYHIKKLKGAKLAVWNVISLSIDENGICNLSVPEIADLSGYSESETRETVRELDEMGYLSVNRRSGRRSLYSPTFAARSTNTPKDTPVQKSDPSRKATPPASSLPDPSSPPLIQAHPSIKELKESLTDKQLSILQKAGLEWLLLKGDVTTEEIEKAITEVQQKDKATRMFESALGFSKPLPWGSKKEWTEFAEWVRTRFQENQMWFGEYNIWRNTPYTKGGLANTRIRGFVKEFYDSWDMFMMSRTPVTQITSRPVPIDQQPDQQWRQGLNLGAA